MYRNNVIVEIPTFRVAVGIIDFNENGVYDPDTWFYQIRGLRDFYLS